MSTAAQPLFATDADRRLIVGLDLSLRATGWCSADATGVQTKGTLWPPKDLTGLPRIDWIYKAVSNVTANAFLVVIEDFSYGSKGAFTLERAGLAYVIRFALWKRQKPFILVAPALLKKFATGRGVKVDKGTVMLEVFKRWGVEANNDDEADAIVLAQIGRVLTSHGLEVETKPQAEVVNKLCKANSELLKRFASKGKTDEN